MTRAKKKAFLVTVNNQESEFAMELKERYGNELKREQWECPLCGGKLLKREDRMENSLDVQIIRLQDVDIKEGLIKIISPEKSVLRALSQQALNLLQQIRLLGRSLTPQIQITSRKTCVIHSKRKAGEENERRNLCKIFFG